MPKRNYHQPPMIDADHIRDNAVSIRDIMQAIINACENETQLDAYTRSKLAGGSIATDIAALCIEIIVHEMEHN